MHSKKRWALYLLAVLLLAIGLALNDHGSFLAELFVFSAGAIGASNLATWQL